MFQRQSLFIKVSALLMMQNGLLAVTALHLSAGVSTAMMAALAAGVIVLSIATAMMATRIAGVQGATFLTAPITAENGAVESLPPLQPQPVSMNVVPRPSPANDGDAGQSAQSALAALDAALRRLATGDLGTRIERPLSDDFEGLRGDFNHGMTILDSSMGVIASASDNLHRECTEARLRLSGQRCAVLDDIPVLAALDDGLRETSRNLRDQDANLRDIATRTADARSHMACGNDAVEEAIATITAIAGCDGKINAMASAMRDVAFRTNMLSVNASVAAANGTAPHETLKSFALELRGLAEEGAEAAKQASVLERETVLSVTRARSSLEQVNRADHRTIHDLETLQARILSASETCGDSASMAIRTSSVLSELALSKGQQTSSDKAWETTLDQLMREVQLIDQNCSRFIPVTVLREGPPPDDRPPVTGRHLRLVKS